jgi:hypothetical protein
VRLFAALGTLVSAAALAAGDAAAHTPAPAVTQLRPTSATVSWGGSVQSRVEYGFPGRLGLWSARTANRREAQLTGLLPQTAYEVQLRNGASVRFRTPAAPTTTSTVGAGGAILLDGSPFIPIMQWLQCPWYFKREVALGFNVFLGRGCSNSADAGEVAALGALGAYSVLPYDRAVATSPALFGWRFGDEPDLDSNAVRPATIQHEYRTNRAADSRHLNFLTVTSGFYSRQSPPGWANGDRSIYAGYARGTDAIGFDLYPVTGWCRPDWLPEVYAAQRELVRYAAGRPTYQWIEATPTSSKWCTGRGVTPGEVRSEVWQALIGGAKAVGYFTHSWKPTYSQFRVAPAVQAAMRRSNREIEALAPALLARSVRVVASPAGRVIALGRRFHGATYVVLANLERQPAAATLQLPGSGTLHGFDSDALVRVAGGKAQLTLPPLAVEILIAPPRG